MLKMVIFSCLFSEKKTRAFFCIGKNVETIFYFIILRGRLQDTVVIRTFHYDKPRYDLAKKKLVQRNHSQFNHENLCFLSYKILQKKNTFFTCKDKQLRI